MFAARVRAVGGVVERCRLPVAAVVLQEGPVFAVVVVVGEQQVEQGARKLELADGSGAAELFAHFQQVAVVKARQAVIGMEQTAGTVEVVAALRGAVEAFERKPVAGTALGGGGQQAPGAGLQSGAFGQLQAGGFAQAFFVAKRLDVARGVFDEPGFVTGLVDGAAMVRVAGYHPDLRLGARAAGAANAQQLLQDVFGFAVVDGLRGKAERGVVAIVGDCLRLPGGFVVERADGAVANVGEAVQRGDLRGRNALLAEVAVLEQHAPAVRQAVGKDAVQAVRQVEGGGLNAAVGAQMVGREVAVCLQVGGVVGEVHAVAVLREGAGHHLTPVGEGAALDQAAGGFMAGH